MQVLTFNQMVLKTIHQHNQIWLSSSELAKALDYADVRSIANIYNRNKDEFSQGMTEVINLVTSDKSENLQTATRIFSLRGCHLIAMFARTKVAKQFRQWVLDILDKEVGAPVISAKITDTQAYKIQKAIKSKCQHNKVHYQTLYHALYDAFGVKSYKDLSPSEFEQALAFIESYRFTPDAKLYDVLADCYTHLRHYTRLAHYMHSVHADSAQDTLSDIVRLSQQMGLTNQYGRAMFERIGHERRLNYYHGNALIIR